MLGKAAGEGLAATTAYLFGRKTYQKMAAHWPTEPDTNPIAAHLNAAPKYVVTRTLTRLERAGSHVLGGDVVASAEAAGKRRPPPRRGHLGTGLKEGWGVSRERLQAIVDGLRGLAAQPGRLTPVQLRADTARLAARRGLWADLPLPCRAFGKAQAG